MSKQLKDMTNEELWQLFPIVLKAYNPDWPKDYKNERMLLMRILGEENIARISHIGSTAVKGLLAKPIVDILLEIAMDTDINLLITIMEQNEYLFSSQPKKPAPHMMFLKGYTPNGFAENVFHVHIRFRGDWDELYFCDYLNAHPETAAEYAKLKTELMQRYEHNRDGYTDAKTMFVNRITALARIEMGDKYK